MISTSQIQEYIKKPLAEMVLFGDLASSGGVATVRVDESGDNLIVSTETEKSAEVAELVD